MSPGQSCPLLRGSYQGPKEGSIGDLERPSESVIVTVPPAILLPPPAGIAPASTHNRVRPLLLNPRQMLDHLPVERRAPGHDAAPPEPVLLAPYVGNAPSGLKNQQASSRHIMG